MMAGIDAPGIDALVEGTRVCAPSSRPPRELSGRAARGGRRGERSAHVFVRLLSPEDGDDFTNDEILLTQRLGAARRMHDGANPDDEPAEQDDS